jgi:hypothetical protein
VSTSASSFVISRLFRRDDPGEPVAVASTSRLSLIAGRYVGKDDPIMVVRAQSGLPAVGRRAAGAVRLSAPGCGLDAWLAQRAADALRAGREPAGARRRAAARAGGRDGVHDLPQVAECLAARRQPIDAGAPGHV